jgi:urease accessory protein
LQHLENLYMTPQRQRLLILTLLFCLSLPAWAHGDHGDAAPLGGGSFMTGFLHPFSGWDHVTAMVAVGLWGAFLGRPAIWVLPVVFPLVMALGGFLGLVGVPLPGIEVGIALSAAVLGVMVAAAARPPLWVAALIVGGFAIFHGHAHGTELPSAADPLLYSLGFVMATGIMHAAGIAFGALVRWPAGRWAVRAGGGLIGLAGLGFLAAAFA